MSITLKRFPGGFIRSVYDTPPGISCVSRNSVGTSTKALEWFLDRKQPGITTDIEDGAQVEGPGNGGPGNGGLSYADPEIGWVQVVYVVTGTARDMVPGKDVVIEASTDGQGYFAIEDSPDGVTWTRQFIMRATSGDTHGLRFTPGAAKYRVVYYDNGTHGSKRVRVYSQSRT